MLTDVPYLALVRRTPGISCEAVPASDRDGAGMRRRLHPRKGAAESFDSFIPLFDGASRMHQLANRDEAKASRLAGRQYVG
jgi:hypothetical protein